MITLNVDGVNIPTKIQKDHILGYKMHLSKLEITKIIQFLLSVHKEIKQVINNRKTAKNSE